MAMLAYGVAPPDRRILARLGAFTAASIALHVLTLGAPLRGAGGSAAMPESSGARVLHAVLAPATFPRQGDRTAEAHATVQQNASMSPIPAQSHGAGAADADMPLPDKWYTASEVDVRAQPITREKLDYPAELGPLGPSGKVRVRLFIDERGIVHKVEIAQSGAVEAFDRAAMAAFRHVRFSPAMKGGAPVKSQKLLELDFAPDLALR